MTKKSISKKERAELLTLIRHYINNGNREKAMELCLKNDINEFFISHKNLYQKFKLSEHDFQRLTSTEINGEKVYFEIQADEYFKKRYEVSLKVKKLKSIIEQSANKNDNNSKT